MRNFFEKEINSSVNLRKEIYHFKVESIDSLII